MLFQFSACSEDEPNNPYDEEAKDQNDDKPNSGLPEEDIMSIIKENVSVSATYQNYIWYINIESTLGAALPDRTIRFGIGHGDVNGTTQVSVTNNAYSYYERTIGDTTLINFKNPFWFYFMFGMSPSDNEASALCEMYYASYLALVSKGSSNWSSDETNLYSELTQYLNKYEREANSRYKPSVQVQVDGKRFYTIATLKP